MGNGWKASPGFSSSKGLMTKEERRVMTTTPSVYTTSHLPQQPGGSLIPTPRVQQHFKRKTAVPGSHAEAGPRPQWLLQSTLPLYPGPRANKQDHASSSSTRVHREAEVLKAHASDNRQNTSETTSEAKWKEGSKPGVTGEHTRKITVGQKSSSAPAR